MGWSWGGPWGGHSLKKNVFRGRGCREVMGRSWGSHGEVMGRSWGGRERVLGWSVGCLKYLPTRGVFRGVFFLKSVHVKGVLKLFS